MPMMGKQRLLFADRVCAVVATSSAHKALRQLREARRHTRTIELRLDWLRSDSERSKFLAALPRYRGNGLTLIATCRRILGGGKLSGGAEAELYWLTQSRKAGCEWCDIEVETLRELPGQSARDLPVPPRILLSFHDFEGTAPVPAKRTQSRSPDAHEPFRTACGCYV